MDISARPLHQPARYDCSRRAFCRGALCTGIAASLGRAVHAQGATGVHFSVGEFDRLRILAAAEAALKMPALTLAKLPAPGAARDPHLFYSEQVARNGELSGGSPELSGGSSEPFLGHADLLVQMNGNVAALTAAWRLQHDDRFHAAAMAQLRAWCLDPATRMAPTLQSSGVLPGKEDDARYSGLAQTVCLAETARAASFLLTAAETSAEEATAIRQWFADLLTWMNESQKGSIARDTKEQQAICWTMQAAEFARFTRNDVLLRECTHRFRDKLLRQMNLDGIFTSSLQSDRPFAGAMFTLECMAAACESVSTPFDSVWKFNLPDGRGMHSAVAWALPYLQSRGKWPYKADALYFSEQPMRQNALLFAGRAFDRPEYIETWKALKSDTATPALRREHPITQPALWAVRPPA